MRKPIVGFCFCGLSLLMIFVAGCKQTSPVSPFGGSGSAPVVVTIHDPLPTTTTVLSLRLPITGLTLVGTNGTANASLLSSTQTVQLTNLETLNEVIAQTTAPSGTYSGLTISFGVPVATILNSSGSTLSFNGTGSTVTCATATTCLGVSPAVTTSSVTVTPSPSGLLTVVNGQPVQFSIDLSSATSFVNTTNTISFNPGLTGAVTVAANIASSASPNAELTDNSAVLGTVTSVGAGQFTITDANTGIATTINTSVATTYVNYRNGINACADNPADFGCVAAGQVVVVNYTVDNDVPTTDTAISVGLIADATGLGFGRAAQHEVLLGIVVGTPTSTPATGAGTFNMVVSAIAGSGVPSPLISVGSTVNVTPTAASWSVVNTTCFIAPVPGTSACPAALAFPGTAAPFTTSVAFTALTSVIVGQNVLVDVVSAGAGTPPTVVADQIQLYPTQLSFAISATTPTLTLGTLGPLYGTIGGQTTIAVSNSAAQSNPIPFPTIAIGANPAFFFNGLLYKSGTANPNLYAVQQATLAH